MTVNRLATQKNYVTEAGNVFVKPTTQGQTLPESINNKDLVSALSALASGGGFAPDRVITIDSTLSADIEGKAYRHVADADAYIALHPTYVNPDDHNEYPLYYEVILPAGDFDEEITLKYNVCYTGSGTGTNLVNIKTAMVRLDTDPEYENFVVPKFESVPFELGVCSFMQPGPGCNGLSHLGRIKNCHVGYIGPSQGDFHTEEIYIAENCTGAFERNGQYQGMTSLVLLNCTLNHMEEAYQIGGVLDTVFIAAFNCVFNNVWICSGRTFAVGCTFNSTGDDIFSKIRLGGISEWCPSFINCVFNGEIIVEEWAVAKFDSCAGGRWKVTTASRFTEYMLFRNSDITIDTVGSLVCLVCENTEVRYAYTIDNFGTTVTSGSIGGDLQLYRGSHALFTPGDGSNVTIPGSGSVTVLDAFSSVEFNDVSEGTLTVNRFDALKVRYCEDPNAVTPVVSTTDSGQSYVGYVIDDHRDLTDPSNYNWVRRTGTSLTNVILVDSNFPANVEGKYYTTFAAAKAYCDLIHNGDSQASPVIPANPDARFEIHLPAGNFTEQVTLSTYYTVVGHRTRITHLDGVEISEGANSRFPKTISSMGVSNADILLQQFTNRPPAIIDCIIDPENLVNGTSELVYKFYSMERCRIERQTYTNTSKPYIVCLLRFCTTVFPSTNDIPLVYGAAMGYVVALQSEIDSISCSYFAASQCSIRGNICAQTIYLSECSADSFDLDSTFVRFVSVKGLVATLCKLSIAEIVLADGSSSDIFAISFNDSRLSYYTELGLPINSSLNNNAPVVLNFTNVRYLYTSYDGFSTDILDLHRLDVTGSYGDKPIQVKSITVTNSAISCTEAIWFMNSSPVGLIDNPLTVSGNGRLTISVGDGSYVAPHVSGNSTLQLGTYSNSYTMNIYGAEVDNYSKLYLWGTATVTRGLTVRDYSKIELDSNATVTFASGIKWSCDSTSSVPESVLGYGNMQTPETRQALNIRYSDNPFASQPVITPVDDLDKIYMGFMSILGGDPENSSNYIWVEKPNHSTTSNIWRDITFRKLGYGTGTTSTNLSHYRYLSGTTSSSNYIVEQKAVITTTSVLTTNTSVTDNAYIIGFRIILPAGANHVQLKLTGGFAAISGSATEFKCGCWVFKPVVSIIQGFPVSDTAVHLYENYAHGAVTYVDSSGNPSETQTSTVDPVPAMQFILSGDRALNAVDLNIDLSYYDNDPEGTGAGLTANRVLWIGIACGATMATGLQAFFADGRYYCYYEAPSA